MSNTCTYAFDPAAHDETTVTGTYSCTRDAAGDGDRCVFHMTPEERSARGVTDATLHERLREALERGTGDDRVFVGASLPALDLEYLDVAGADQHPIDLRHATIAGAVSMAFTRVEEPLDLRHADLAGFAAENAYFEKGLFCSGATFDGPVTLYEAVVSGEDAAFDAATFHDDVVVDEANFDDDVSFDRATFTGEASFRGTQFYGNANSIGDNTTFVEAVFEGAASFRHATLEYTSFDRCSFESDVTFDHATAGGTVTFEDATFGGVADFDEAEFEQDAHFDGATFAAEASFRGTRVEGGTAVMAADIGFAGATFEERANFERGVFGTADFAKAVFEDAAVFERVDFEENVDFERVGFHETADFDEVQFHGDSTFANATFRGSAIFRGSEFHGETNYLEDDAVFTGAVFRGDADFRRVTFTAANFEETAFEGHADFTETTFTDSLQMKIVSFGEGTVFDFTRARIPDGRIVQPEDGWVRYDFTETTIGSVSLDATTADDRRNLLSYFRFCDTTFDGFDFSAHTEYLDRNNWTLHAFDAGDTDHDFAVEMTPAVIEKTYLKAKQDASAQSNIKAAGEFRVKRQHHAREKFVDIVRDPSEPLSTRGRNALRAGENLFLGVSCGYGLRLYRIAAVFVFFPLLSGLLFAFGGEPFATGTAQVESFEALTTAEGIEALAMNVYFSYITFLTIGYGTILPVGIGARFVAAALVYLNVILAGLFLYALIKRSEI